MRIIAGEFRGRKLLSPDGDQTRPVTDRVKQSVFDMLMPYVEGAIVYDCFAGTGSFGLESLSRGAKHATFFESHRQTAKLLRTNIDTLRVADRATIITADCFSHFGSARPAARADLVFLDPPYRYLNEVPDQLQQAAKAIAEFHLADEGLVLFRHDAADTLLLDALRVIDVREYGSMVVEVLGTRKIA
jgi:16S rRNA (guanine966-N2)-methyltransferase